MADIFCQTSWGQPCGQLYEVTMGILEKYVNTSVLPSHGVVGRFSFSRKEPLCCSSVCPGTCSTWNPMILLIAWQDQGDWDWDGSHPKEQGLPFIDSQILCWCEHLSCAEDECWHSICGAVLVPIWMHMFVCIVPIAVSDVGHDCNCRPRSIILGSSRPSLPSSELSCKSPPRC